MYLALVVGLMIVPPIISVVVELIVSPDAELLQLAGKWFVFWGIGVRLLVAGVSQSLRPSFTAKEILQIADPAAEKLVTELGFANLAFGLLGVLSLPWPQYLLPAALAGGLFLGLDGIKHILNGERKIKENIAMITDLIVAVVALVYAFGVLL